jgi:hypothetical protein
MPPLARLAIVTVTALACGCVSGTGHDVAGRVCIVLDIRNPGLCGALQLVDGLRVEEIASGRHTTTSPDGYFSVAIPAKTTSAVLRVTADSNDRRTTLVSVPSVPAEGVLAPIITDTLWGTYLTALHVPAEDPATAAFHVSFPYPGALIGSAGVTGATLLLYDQGQAFDWLTMPPGDQTIAFLAFGVPADTGTATIKVVSRTDEVLFEGDVPVEAGATTWLHVEP